MSTQETTQTATPKKPKASKKPEKALAKTKKAAKARKRTEVTGCEARMNTKVGGTFSTGKVTGLNVDLVPGRRLVQAWRRNDFPEGIYSMAAITLAPTPRGGTELVPTHRGVLKHLLHQIEDYWRRVYWAPMKEFGG